MEKMEELKPTPRGLNLNDGWEDQVNRRAAQKAAKRQTNRTMLMFCLALVLIVAGGIYLGHSGELPLGISVALEISGVALLCFTIGLLVGRRHR